MFQEEEQVVEEEEARRASTSRKRVLPNIFEEDLPGAGNPKIKNQQKKHAVSIENYLTTKQSSSASETTLDMTPTTSTTNFVTELVASTSTVLPTNASVSSEPILNEPEDKDLFLIR